VQEVQSIPVNSGQIVPAMASSGQIQQGEIQVQAPRYPLQQQPQQIQPPQQQQPWVQAAFRSLPPGGAVVPNEFSDAVARITNPVLNAIQPGLGDAVNSTETGRQAMAGILSPARPESAPHPAVQVQLTDQTRGQAAREWLQHMLQGDNITTTPVTDARRRIQDVTFGSSSASAEALDAGHVAYTIPNSSGMSASRLPVSMPGLGPASAPSTSQLSATSVVGSSVSDAAYGVYVAQPAATQNSYSALATGAVMSSGGGGGAPGDSGRKSTTSATVMPSMLSDAAALLENGVAALFPNLGDEGNVNKRMGDYDSIARQMADDQEPINFTVRGTAHKAARTRPIGGLPSIYYVNNSTTTAAIDAYTVCPAVISSSSRLRSPCEFTENAQVLAAAHVGKELGAIATVSRIANRMFSGEVYGAILRHVFPSMQSLTGGFTRPIVVGALMLQNMTPLTGDALNPFCVGACMQLTKPLTPATTTPYVFPYSGNRISTALFADANIEARVITARELADYMINPDAADAGWRSADMKNIAWIGFHKTDADDRGPNIFYTLAHLQYPFYSQGWAYSAYNVLTGAAIAPLNGTYTPYSALTFVHGPEPDDTVDAIVKICYVDVDEFGTTNTASYIQITTTSVVGGTNSIFGGASVVLGTQLLYGYTGVSHAVQVQYMAGAMRRLIRNYGTDNDVNLCYAIMASRYKFPPNMMLFGGAHAPGLFTGSMATVTNAGEYSYWLNAGVSPYDFGTWFNCLLQNDLVTTSTVSIGNSLPPRGNVYFEIPTWEPFKALAMVMGMIRRADANSGLDLSSVHHVGYDVYRRSRTCGARWEIASQLLQMPAELQYCSSQKHCANNFFRYFGRTFQKAILPFVTGPMLEIRYPGQDANNQTYGNVTLIRRDVDGNVMSSSLISRFTNVDYEQELSYPVAPRSINHTWRSDPTYAGSWRTLDCVTSAGVSVNNCLALAMRGQPSVMDFIKMIQLTAVGTYSYEFVNHTDISHCLTNGSRLWPLTLYCTPGTRARADSLTMVAYSSGNMSIPAADELPVGNCFTVLRWTDLGENRPAMLVIRSGSYVSFSHGGTVGYVALVGDGYDTGRHNYAEGDDSVPAKDWFVMQGGLRSDGWPGNSK